MGTADADSELEALEIKLLLEGIFRHVGYDFRDYASASIRRRILGQVQAEGTKSVSGLQDRALHEPACMERLLLGLTVHQTSLFRDPGFYLAFRQKVVPLLATYPFARIWHAGCSSGEEVYSLAILLREEGIHERCRIYATDLSEAILRRAREGLFPLHAMREYTESYQRAGGKRSFSEYYTARYDHAMMSASLREGIVFAPHNLVTDGSFNEFNVILCRNVMIYFNKSLQDRVHGLLYRSLSRLGVLGLGRKESLRFTPHETFYEALDEPERLYRRAT
ncbi:MAG: protein-glutamate O-methyltransferase CheR [Deltaproteobacteria bacterium]|nr:protein-glutamate O-methyltransferase CheR [Deltaproteobacteria bacterium]